jgi:phosphatidylinositol alpha-mannosyltransferase
LGFIGRFEEPRKGLSILVEALRIVSRFAPDVRVFVAGPGDTKDVIDSIDPQLRSRFTFLGKISEQDKANFLASISLYIAPNTGGESFGIILAEALAGGATVVASDIPAFDSLLNHGQCGELFESESSTDLAKRIIDLLRDDERRIHLGKAGKKHAQQFDWKVVADQIFSIYEMSLVSGEKVRLASENRAWSRFIGRDQRGDD